MLYKTITLTLVQESPHHEALRLSGTLRQALDHYTGFLHHRHAVWQHLLAQDRPGTSPPLLSSMALELATAELRMALLSPSTALFATLEAL